MLYETRGWYDKRLEGGDTVYCVPDRVVGGRRRNRVRAGRLAIVGSGSYPDQCLRLQVDFLDKKRRQPSGMSGLTSMSVFTEEEVLFTLAGDMGVPATGPETIVQALRDADVNRRLATTLLELIDARRHRPMGEPAVEMLNFE